jgi:hypothetical protein
MFSFFKNIRQINNNLRQIKRTLQQMNMRMIHPSLKVFNIRSLMKDGVIMLVYNVTAGVVVDKDVTERRLTVTVNDAPVSTKSYAADAVVFDEVGVNQGDKVVLTLVDVDDAGNVSEPAVCEFVGNDTIPPVKPGEFGVALVREV